MGFGIGLNLFHVPTTYKLKSNDRHDLIKTYCFLLLNNKE